MSEEVDCGGSPGSYGASAPLGKSDLAWLVGVERNEGQGLVKKGPGAGF